MLDDTTLQLLVSLGPTGIMAVAVLMFVRMAKAVMPSENVQSQMFGFMERQLKVTERLETKIEQGDCNIADVIGKFTSFMETFTARVGEEHQEHMDQQTAAHTLINAVKDKVDHVDTQLLTVTGAVNTMVKNQEDTSLHEKVDMLIKEVRAIRAESTAHYQRVGKRLDALEVSASSLQKEVNTSIEQDATEPKPDTIPQDTPAKAPPPVSFSKSRARSNRDPNPNIPANNGKATKKDDDNDSELVDPVPSGG